MFLKSTENKILVYKTILKTIWTYGVPLRGIASKSNIELLQRYQNKVLRAIVNAPWYVPNRLVSAELGIPTVWEKITNNSRKYKRTHVLLVDVHSPLLGVPQYQTHVLGRHSLQKDIGAFCAM
jgi:hypothetical protein